MEKYKNDYDNSKDFADELLKDLYQEDEKNEEAKNKKRQKNWKNKINKIAKIENITA